MPIYQKRKGMQISARHLQVLDGERLVRTPKVSDAMNLTGEGSVMGQ
jgi:hypothetical protein